MNAADRHVWVRLPFWLIDFAGLVLDERSTETSTEYLVQHVDVDGRAVLDWRKSWELLPVNSPQRRPTADGGRASTSR
ncbi:hypothetical protein [Nocardioides sp. SLBN-35]|uniref:hypothetical protein n=1 Tax=Nocardioides sp. SLBN-35 TaxID=2768445 RepID=UPI001153C6DF|nr:hypothetical protein [Nocardioides sp. SLBN-35]TQK73351.1 hypothetical protein FBY23_5183 [Nocardioides sp. SLBN-35]